MNFKFFKKLIFLFVLIYAQTSWACQADPSHAHLSQGIRIIAKAQYGLHLEGMYSVPEVILIEPMQDNTIPLKIVGQASGQRDVRSLLERMTNKLPRYETFLIPKTLEIRPQGNSENDLRYRMEFKDGSATVKVEIYFQGGVQKTMRAGCGAEKAQIEML